MYQPRGFRYTPAHRPTARSWQPRQRPPVARRVPVHTAPRPIQAPSHVADTGAANSPVPAPFDQVEYRYSDLTARFPKLCLSPDFYLLSFEWARSKEEIPIEHSISFVNNTESSVEAPAATESKEDEGTGVHVARVVLLNVVPDTKQIKFLVSKATAGGVKAIGGAWSNAIDGGKPEDDATMVKVAKRHCLETCGVDLGACDKWIKLFEMRYRRADGRVDRTVLFIPNVWDHLTSGDVSVMKQVSKKITERKEEREVEGTDGKEKETVTVTSTEEEVVMRSMELSLMGILEYDLDDKDEATTELSLVGEFFCHMRAASVAPKILEVLSTKRKAQDEVAATNKRRRDEENAERAAKQEALNEERAAKRQKLEDEKKAEAEAKAKALAEEKYMTEEEIRVRQETDRKIRAEKAAEEAARRKEEAERIVAQAQAKKEEMEAKKKADAEHRLKFKIVTHRKSEVDEPAQAAFKALNFSGNGTRLSRETLAAVLYSMGTLPKREVEALLRSAGLTNPRSAIDYVRYTTTTTVTTEEVPVEEKKEEEAKDGEDAKKEDEKETKEESKAMEEDK